MSLDLNDTFGFGKHKGEVVGEVILDDPDYCCWLREKIRSEIRPQIFSNEANARIDDAIRQSPKRLRKYKPWDSDTEDGSLDVTMPPADAMSARQTAYAGEWGTW